MWKVQNCFLVFFGIHKRRISKDIQKYPKISKIQWLDIPWSLKIPKDILKYQKISKVSQVLEGSKPQSKPIYLKNLNVASSQLFFEHFFGIY